MPLQALPPDAQFQMPGMGDVTTGPEAEAKMLDIGATGLSNMSQALMQHAADNAKLTGALAGAKSAIQYDQNGNLLPLSKLPMDQSITSQAFRESAIGIYTNTVSNQATQYAKALARDPQLQGNPRAFLSAWNEYQTKTLTGLDPMVAGSITSKLIEIGGNTYSTLADNLVASNKASSGLLGEQAIAETLGMTSQRVDKTGDTPAARDYIDNQVRDKESGVGVQLLNLNNSDSLKYNPGKLSAMLKDFYQKAYGAMSGGQAAQFGATETRQPDGSITGDSTGYQQYIDKLRADPQFAQYFNADEFKTMVEGPAKARFDAAQGGMQAQYSQDKINSDAAIHAGVGDLNFKAAQATLLFNQRKDMSGINAVLQQSIQTKFSSNHDEDVKLRYAFDLDLVKKMNDGLNSPDEVEKMRLLGTIFDTSRKGPNQRIPDGRAGTETLKTAQLIYDSRYAAATGQPGAAITATTDPDAVYAFAFAPGTGYLENTGRIMPRLVDNFKNGINAATSLSDANAIYANFLTAQVAAPDELKVEMTDQERSNILLWGEAGQNIDEYVKLRSITMGGQLQAGYETRASAMMNANKDKNYTYQSLQGAIQEALVSSSTILGAVRQGVGFAPNPNAEKLPVNYQEGYFGLSIPFDDAGRRALGYMPTNTLRVDMDPGAEQAWAYAQAHAAGTGSTGDGIFQAALGDMFQQGYNISKLLMPAQIETETVNADGTRGPPRDLTNDVTFGLKSPESYYKDTAVNIAMDASMTIADVYSKQPGLRERLQGIEGVLSPDFFRYGDRRYWAEQYTEGRLKMHPETGIGGKFMGYSILGLLETPYGNRWVPLNPPGQYYNYDQQNGPLAREVLKGTGEARTAQVSTQKAYGETSAGGRIMGDVSGTMAGTIAGGVQREFVDTGRTKGYLENLWETMFGGGTQPLTAPPSAVLKQ